MKYNESLRRLLSVVSKDHSYRFPMTCAKVDTVKKIAVATDGHALVIIDVSKLVGPQEEGFLIPAEAIKAAHSMAGSKREKKEVHITSEDGSICVKAKGSKRAQYFDLPAGEFPKWESAVKESTGYKPIAVLNPSILAAINTAVAGDRRHGVTLFAKDAVSALLISPNGVEGAYALLMPMRGGTSAAPTPFWTASEDPNGN